MNEQRARVAIAALADTQEDISPSTGMLARDQSQQGAEFPTALEPMVLPTAAITAVAISRTDPFNFGQAPATFVLPKHVLQIYLYRTGSFRCLPEFQYLRPVIESWPVPVAAS